MFKIFEKLGGERAALDLIRERRNLRPEQMSHRAVLDWSRRRAIPPINTIILMQECEQRGIPFDMDDCRLPERKKRASRASAGRVSPPT